jgi:hypothetical protein
MAKRLPTLLPRIAVLVLIALGATAGITLAAGSQVPSAPAVPTVTAAPALPLIVPDVRNQAFVFAKGTLGDAGFAWRVTGSVHGFAANVVVSQSPAPGTPVADTGAPLVKLTLKRNSAYTQSGVAADVSPYAATAVVPTDLSGNPIGPAKPAKSAAPATTATTPGATTPAPAATTPASAATTPAPAATTPAATTPAATTTTPTPATPKTSTAKSVKAAPSAAWPKTRPVAFVAPGARPEPLDEMPLPNRAQALAAWLDTHRAKTAANAKYWLYQNAWIVAGAKMGWWHGAAALETLIAVDRRTQAMWGFGAKSESVARQALDEVRAKAKS